MEFGRRNKESSETKKAHIALLKKAQQELYQVRFDIWLKEKLGEDISDFRWSDLYKKEGIDHKWDGSPDPLYNAWKAISEGHWAAVEAATGTSKTYMLSRLVMWFLDVFEDSLVITSAPKQDQLRKNLWGELAKIKHKFKKIRPLSSYYDLRLVVEDVDINARNQEGANYSKSWHAIGFVTGSTSEEESATKAQGFHRKHMLIILEETPGISQQVMTAFQNTCTAEHNLILAVGNPDSQTDSLHQFCQLKRVKPFRVSAYDYPNVVLGREIFPGAVTRGSIEQRLDKYKSVEHPMFQSRVRGISPSQSNMSLIRTEWLKAAKESKKPYDYSYHSAGVDVSNSEDGDKAAVCYMRGNILKYIKQFHCRNANDLAYNLVWDNNQLEMNGKNDYEVETLDKYDIMPGFVGVDTVGVGVATYNELRGLGVDPISIIGGQWEEALPTDNNEYLGNGTQNPNYGKPLYKFQNLRSQMAYELAKDLEDGNIVIDLEDESLFDQLCEECTIIRYKESGNAIVVEPKDAIKKRLGGKSPNLFDAFMYANWSRKGYRVFTGIMPIGFGTSVLTK